MKKLLTVFFLFFSASVYAGSPVIFIDNENPEYKSLIEGDRLIHTFKISNKGDEVLNINKIRAMGCGCNVLSYSKTINPGESGELRVKVPTSGKAGTTIFHKFYIYSNDNQRKQIELCVKAEIIPFALVNPEKIHFRCNKNETVKKSIKIIPRKGKEFKIVNIVSASGKNVKYELKNFNKNSYELIVENIRNQKGFYSDVLFLKTDNKSHPVIRIDVSGEVSELSPENS